MESAEMFQTLDMGSPHPHPSPHPQHGAACPRPRVHSINKPEAGPRRGIMVHLEVTAKENRALCITNRDGDKHTGALRDLDKGLFKHVRNWIHRGILWRSQAAVVR